jgi:hypothetical protein
MFFAPPKWISGITRGGIILGAKWDSYGCATILIGN